MAIVNWDPWQEIEDLFDRYSRAVGLSRRTGKALAVSGIADWSPQVDIAETPQAFTIKAEIPEVDKDAVKVSIDHGMITISGERRRETEQKDKTWHRVERSYGAFARSFSLPDNVDAATAQAGFKDGVLTLTIPKLAGTSSKAIEVKVS